MQPIAFGGTIARVLESNSVAGPTYSVSFLACPTASAVAGGDGRSLVGSSFGRTGEMGSQDPREARTHDQYDHYDHYGRIGP